MNKAAQLLIDKKQLRKILRKRRSKLSQEEKCTASHQVIVRLSALIKNEQILAFAPLKEEINIWSFVQYLAEKKQLILPKCQGNELILYRVHNIFTQLELSHLGILEPTAQKCEIACFEDITYALIPGLGFDKQNHRIGYGMGFYDRLLPKLKSACKLGVGFTEQLLPHPVPIEGHDYPLDEIILR